MSACLVFKIGFGVKEVKADGDYSLPHLANNCTLKLDDPKRSTFPVVELP